MYDFWHFWDQTNCPLSRVVRIIEVSVRSTAVASMRRTEALASVKCYQILSIFIFFIRLIILEDFIRLISYNGPCVRLGCSFFLATALLKVTMWENANTNLSFLLCKHLGPV